MTCKFFPTVDGDYNEIRQGSDMAVLLNSIEGNRLCGLAFMDSFKDGKTLGVVNKDCVIGRYSFGHEIAHMFGCFHNRETKMKSKNIYPNGFGFLMKPPVHSGFRTIMS